MNKLFIIVCFSLCSSLLWSQQLEYIATPARPIVDTFYNNYIVQDNFRWLEKVNTEEVKDWIKSQNKLSKKYLSRIPKRSRIKNRITDFAATDYTMPTRKKKYSFTYGIYNEISTFALMYKGPGMYDYKVLVDPDDISLKDNIKITGYWVSRYESFVVYLYSRNGSDNKEARIVRLEDGTHFPDHLENIMFSNIEWFKDGFFYNTYDRTDEFGLTSRQKVLYHKIGTAQSEDQLIFERKKHPFNKFSFLITPDYRYFILTEKCHDQEKTNLFYFEPDDGDFRVKPLVANIKMNIEVAGNRDKKVLATSNLGSGGGVLFEIDPKNPYKWRALTPRFSEAVLYSVYSMQDTIAAIYLTDRPVLTLLDTNKNVLLNIEMPKATSASIIGANSKTKYLYYYYSSYTIPRVVYKLHLETFEKKLLQQTEVTFDFNEIDIKKVEYLSGDGTKVPMTIIHKKDMKFDGTNPTLLKAYGGFGIISAPSFDPGIVYFVMQGGVFAFANIRGGGEKGKAWAEAGSGLNKQQSFDDFIAAAEYLINYKYTSPNKLAITGTSNGGLVVAAAAIQRPDLFQAVVPKVAPLDMLRFEKFTVGHNWVKEYGTVEDSLSFTKLLAYSPCYNIQEDVNYPEMLVITSENDDRVPPFHSYKFVARLQNRSSQTNPILLKVEKQSGHYGALTIKAAYLEEIDLYSFILNAFNKTP